MWGGSGGALLPWVESPWGEVLHLSEVKSNYWEAPDPECRYCQGDEVLISRGLRYRGCDMG